MSPRSEQLRDELFDLAVAHPDGFTVDDIKRQLSIPHKKANIAIRELRKFLGEFDDINLVCDPQGSGERWAYRLAGTLDDMRPWVVGRINDADSRLRTIQAMMSTVVRSTHGNSIEGRRARVIERALGRLVEDLDAIDADPGGLLSSAPA